MNIVSETEPVYRPREGDGPADPPSTKNNASTGAPGVAPRPASSRGLLLMAMGTALIAAVAATLSAAGLVAASRTVAEARVAIDALRATRPDTAPPPPSTAASHTESTEPKAATAAQVREVVETLRGDIARYQVARDRVNPAGPAGSAVQEGQAELASRLGAIEGRLGRIEKALSSSR